MATNSLSQLALSTPPTAFGAGLQSFRPQGLPPMPFFPLPSLFQPPLSLYGQQLFPPRMMGFHSPPLTSSSTTASPITLPSTTAASAPLVGQKRPAPCPTETALAAWSERQQEIELPGMRLDYRDHIELSNKQGSPLVAMVQEDRVGTLDRSR